MALSSSTSSISTDTPSSTSTATHPATTSSHTSPEQQQGQQQLQQQQQHTPTATETNNSQGGSDLFQQSWKSESFMGLLNLLHSQPPVSAAQTTVTNNHIITSDSTRPWTALDNSGGADWENEQLRSLLNLSDADMDLFQGNRGGGRLLVDETAPLGQQALHLSPSMTVGQMMQQQGVLNAQQLYQQQLLLYQQQLQQQRRKSSLDGTTTTTTSRRHSSTPLTNPRHATCMTPSIPPAEIKRPDTKEMFVHPGFYSLSCPPQQSQWPSSQQQQGAPVKMGMKRSFQEDDSCPTTNSTFSSSPSPLSSHRHHHHEAMMQGMDLRRHSVDGYHVAAKAAASAAAASSKGGSALPARPRAAWAYSTPPKTPPTSMFQPHTRASTVDYSQVPLGQPYMANNTHVVASPLINHHHHYGTGSPASSPFQPATHFVRSHSSPAGTKLSSAASAFTKNSPISTTDTSGSNSNSGTPRKRRASKFRMDSTLPHTNASAGMIPFDPTALLSHFGLANTLPPPLQQQHPSTTTQGFQQPQSEHAVLFQQQQQQQLQAAIRQQQHQQFAAAAAAAIGAAGGVCNRSGSNSIAGQQNAHAFLMQHLISDPRLSAAGLSAASLPTSTKQQHSTTATANRRNPGEVPSSTLPPDHFIFQEASLLNRNRQQAAQQHHAQQQQQAKQALQAKQLAQQQGGGGGCTRSNSISTTTTGVDVVSGKAAMSRRRSEPVNLYQQHHKHQQLRLHQAQQPQSQQYQHQHQHQHQQQHQQQQQQQQYHLQQQQRHLTTVKEVNLPHASPTPTSSSSSAYESAIPCGTIAPLTTKAIMTTAAEDVSVGGVDDAEKKKKNKASQPEVEFDISSIAIAAEAVEATTLIIESMPDQEVAAAAAAATIDTETEMSLMSTADHVLEFEPAQQVAKLITAKPEHQVVEQSIEQDEQREEGEREEKKEEGEEEPLTAAEAFAKSLTAVTTTMDPAATQLMDQLRLQEYLCVSVSSISLPTGTPSTTMHGCKN
ncbi:hypothetical protein KI688_012520 [Linnemannia hyalina]|uniref:Uncharacterized protein n=1 Tax=Linnemannia hyalina TaxID=64524 RepID=A0A9P8BV52_9FUNG|nr:hypothetical protein KI688_012520 [Linnemannia hyalina]